MHEQLRAVLRDAQAFYQASLGSSWVPDYLNRRNLYAQIEPAGLGYAPAGWTQTLGQLRGIGHEETAIEEAGLARRASTGQLIDVFHDRLTIPLTTPAGELVGFTGRAPHTAGQEVPKYLNSPTSQLFAKHRILYGLHEDADALQRGAMPVLVEGPLDRLALAQASRGLRVVGLAPCGTALTDEQVRALLDVMGPQRPIAVALDPDPAGRAATVRAWELLTAADAQNLLHVPLPEGKDPAELIRAGRGDALRRAVTHNRPLAMAVADQRIAAARIQHGDWQRGLMVARDVCRTDLPYVPWQHVATYIIRLAASLHLNVDLVTDAAAEALAAGPAGTKPGRE